MVTHLKQPNAKGEWKHEEDNYHCRRQGHRGHYRKGMYLSCGERHQYPGYFPDHRTGIFQHDDDRGCDQH